MSACGDSDTLGASSRQLCSGCWPGGRGGRPPRAGAQTGAAEGPSQAPKADREPGGDSTPAPGRQKRGEPCATAGDGPPRQAWPGARDTAGARALCKL